MSIPRVLIPKQKRSRSFSDDDDSTVSLTTVFTQSIEEESLSVCIRKKYVFVLLSVLLICIFVFGFALGQVLPSVTDQEETNAKAPTQSPIFTIYDSDSGTYVSLHPTPIPDPVSAKLDELSMPVDKKLEQLPYLKTSNSNVSAVYSAQALAKLRKTLETSKHFTICVNGGSSSAGGGHIDEKNRFYMRFAEDLKRKFSLGQIDVIDRSHGSRNSFHSAMMAESFFPPQKPDLIIWEFSINDESGGEARNQFILWMRKVRQFYSGSPPPVFLVYLWSQPFTLSNSGVRSTVFSTHRHLGAEFSFCIGHVHLAGYLNLLNWSGYELSKHFLADKHHPNDLSHAVVAAMMEQVFDSNAIAVTVPSTSRYVWGCAEEHDGISIQVLFENGVLSKASFTADEPRNSAPNAVGILSPSKVMTEKDKNFSMTTQYYGKIDPVRRDRHRGLEIPCCRDGSIVFNLVGYVPVTAVQIVLRSEGQGDGGVLRRRRRRQLALVDQLKGLGKNRYDQPILDTKIRVNGAQGYQLVDAENWGCLMSHPLFRNWILMNDPDFVDQLSFCSKHCNEIITIEQLVVF